MASPVSEEVHSDAKRRIDRRIDEAHIQALIGPRKVYAGPAYNAMEVHGFNVNPRDTSKTKVPSIKFQGTDTQYQEVLDKTNEVTIRKLLRRRTKLDVKIHKLEVKLRMVQDLKIRQLEKRLFNLETLTRY